MSFPPFILRKTCNIAVYLHSISCACNTFLIYKCIYIYICKISANCVSVFKDQSQSVGFLLDKVSKYTPNIGGKRINSISICYM